MEYKVDKLKLVLPDRFKTLSKEELLEINQNKNIDRGEYFSAMDEEKKLLVLVSWMKIPFLWYCFPSFASFSSVLANTEKQNQKNIMDYQLIKKCQFDIKNDSADGFRYSYTAENSETKGKKMIAENLYLEYKNKYYCFACYAKAEDFDEQYPVFREILKTIQFS